MKTKNIQLLILASFFLISCGGGGGGGGESSTPPIVPTVTVSLNSSQSEAEINTSVTLSWSSTNATGCNASGAWSGTKGTSGSEEVTLTTAGTNTFSLSCSSSQSTGSNSVSILVYRFLNGKTIDGYIRGADIWFDTDNDFQKNESRTTTSDTDGSFVIRYDGGTLLSLGGFDVDTGNLLENLMLSHPLEQADDAVVITPVTSLMLGFEDDTKIKPSLGIDESINISIADPVSSKGDGGIGDYYYEKGNQLTVLSLALQNVANAANTSVDSSQDYFLAIAQELEKEYTSTTAKVDIESNAFITKVIDNIITSKTLTISEENKNNLSSVLSATMPILQVQNSDANTTAVFDFLITSLITDAVSASKGEIAADRLSQYQNNALLLVATEQNLEIASITPNITAIDDELSVDEDSTQTLNVLANDNYLMSSPITVSIGSPADGTATVENGVVSYAPSNNFNGTDTLSYTITQNDKTSSANINITVSPVNDAPSIDTPFTITVAEGVTTVTTVEVSDIDGDTDLTLTLGGTDAQSFSLSTERVLSFVTPPVYAEKSEYNITLEVSDGSLATSKDITILIQNPNSAPQISANTLSEDENIISLANLTLSDADIDQLSVSITPTPPEGNFRPREIGTVDDLDGKETITLGNEDGTPFIISADTTYTNQTVKIISDIQLADGVKLLFQNSGVFGLNENNFPTIEVRGGTFDCEASKMRRLDISFIDGDQNNPGFIDIGHCSWIKGILSRPSGNAVYGGFRIMYSYLEDINRGAYAYIWYPDNLYIEGNQIYNSGGFSIGYRESDVSGKQLGISGNVFVNSQNAIPVATGDCINSVHICLWAAYGDRNLPISENSFLTTNIRVLQQIYDVSNKVWLENNYWGITSGDISSRYYSNINNLSYGEVCNGKCGSPRYSVSPNNVLPPKFQPRLIYDGDYTFSFDVAPDYEAAQRNYYYDITFSDGEFTVTEPVTIQINDVTD